MRRRIPALAASVSLCIALVATPASAGGRFLTLRGHGVPAPSAPTGGVKAAPVVRPTGAFGSPGGFPFVASDIHRRRGAHRLVRHGLLPRFPSTVLLSTPVPFYGATVDAPAPVVNVSPVVHASPIVYVDPTVVVRVSTPAVSHVEPAPPPPPLPNVVGHPTGRYELRGDGTTTPYTWVWIPNPPTGPPDAPIPPSGGPEADSSRGSARSTTYRWTDDEGTTFWTNRPESIPEAHRSRARGPGGIAGP